MDCGGCDGVCRCGGGEGVAEGEGAGDEQGLGFGGAAPGVAC